MKKLNPNQPRTDLTDRECSKILGGTIGGLLEMANHNTVHDAVRWWANLSDEHWASMFNTTSPDIAGAFSSYLAPSEGKEKK